jgi:hypothetical protein
MLQSPRFLYVLELPERDVPTGQVVRADAYTIASRLSLFIANASPDEVLLDAAAAGELATTAGIKKHADRLMHGPRFKAAMATFFTSMFDLGRLRDRVFDKALYPKGTDTLGDSALEETVRSLSYNLLDAGLDYREALVSGTTFLNKELAAVYGVPAPAATGFAQATLPATANRHGMLTQIGFLAASSSPTDTNPMVRGRQVRQDLLCQHIPDPPPDVNAQLAPLPAGKAATKKERLAEHRRNPECAVCHFAIDPPGLALESYDAIGAWRASEGGLAIDASGELDGVAFADAKGFAAAVKNHPDLAACLVTKLYRFATAHIEGPDQKPLLRDLGRAFDQGGRKLGPLASLLATSDAFAQMTMPPR